MQRDAAGVAGELAGDVEDAVAQSFGLAALVFAVEGEMLGPGDDVVGGERELEPRGVRGEREVTPRRAADSTARASSRQL